jgi:protein-S-isoprenylcysteine O-methyltransferase Ste14
MSMIEPLSVTILPIVFMIALIGGEKLLQSKNIDMGGEPPIGKALFSSSKYSILLLWVVMIAHSWGINLSFIKTHELLKWVSLYLWVSGFALLFIGRLGLGDSFRIGSPKESTNLKVDGLFRFSRNPMYLGMYATLFAPALYTLNPLLFIIDAYVVIVHHKIVLAEEQYLQRAFGEQYTEYCLYVRRYI